MKLTGFWFRLLLIGAGCSGCLTSAVSAGELLPSFPDHAAIRVPLSGARDVSPRVYDYETPFSWDQTAVVLEGQASDRFFRAADPDPNPQQLIYTILPATPTHLRVTSFDSNIGLQSVQILPKQGGNLETFQFQASTRGLTSGIYNFTYDIRAANTKVRVAPAVGRTGGTFTAPGQVVRFGWTPTSGEKLAKCEAALTGKTGPATGLSSSVITAVLGTRVRPAVLGHYLMLVTPRDVRGQPALGSDGNGVVFRCVFGTDNLPPVTDGFSADDFTPAVNQTITLHPNATDPETAQTVFSNTLIEFGDGNIVSGITGSTTHSYAAPGIYRVRGTVADNLGATATAEDSVIVGATPLPTMAFVFNKQIPPEEAGDGLNNSDYLKATFTDVKGSKISAGDRIIFLYNRNQFGRLGASDHADDVDIIISRGGTFAGKTRIAQNLSIAASGGAISVTVTNAQLDRTGDPRLGRSELKGIFVNQRIALAIIPANGSTPRVLLYSGNINARVKNGAVGRGFIAAETLITGSATTRQPNPRIMEP